VYLIEDHPLNFPDNLAASVNHIPQNLGRHHQTSGVLVNSHVTSHQTDVTKLVLKLSILLVRKSLDRGCVYHSAVPLKRIGNSVLRNRRLTCRRVGANQNRLIRLYSSDRFGLEGVQNEGVLFGLKTSLVLFSFIVFGVVHLMDASLLFSDPLDLDVLQSFLADLLILLILFLQQQRLLGMEWVSVVDLSRTLLFCALWPVSFDGLLEYRKGVFAFHCC
jgi:hypothetical protein